MSNSQFQEQPFPSNQASTTTPAQPAQTTMPTAQQWAQEFQQEQHREPTMAEYQTALAAGHIAQDTGTESKPHDPSFQQMGDGFKQVAAGAKGLYESRVAPAVERSGVKDFYADKVAPAARNAMTAAQQHSASAQSSISSSTKQRWMARAIFILPAAAFLAIFALFMPIASGMGMSLNYFNEDVRGEGIMLTLFMLATIVASSFAILRSTKVLRIVAGVVGLVTSLLGLIDGFGTMFSVSDTSGASVGLGLVLLSLLSVIMLASSILILMSARTASSQSPAQQS